MSDPYDFAEIFKHHREHVSSSKPLLTSRGRVLTYGQMDDLTARLYRWFEQQNLKQGQRVILISTDGLALSLAFLGCIRYGLTAVVVDPESAPEQRARFIQAAKAAALLVDEKILKEGLDTEGLITLPIADKIDHKKPGFLNKVFGAQDEEAFPHMLYHLEPSDQADMAVPLEESAYILFTSGTTSRPKGVEITHKNLMANMRTLIKHYGYTADTNILNILPLHHADGLLQGPFIAFVAGATAHRPLRFQVGRIPALIDAIYKYRITDFVTVPAMLQLIETFQSEAPDSFKTPDFKHIISTAGYLDPQLWQRFEERFGLPITNVYGLTETVCEALYCGPDAQTKKIGTVGKPVDTHIRLVDDSGADVPAGEPGELWLSGDNIMKGYFDMPEETAAVLTPDGWLKTGDLCQIDEDGFCTIVGRKKNVIIVGGMNVYPDDVANVLRGLDGVLDAAVWGEKDETWGEIVVAALMPDPAFSQAGALDPEKLAQEFLGYATADMAPRTIHIVEDFPRGPAGKIIVRDLQAQIAQTKKSVEKGSSDHEALVMRIAAHCFKAPLEHLKPEYTQEDVKGWDSMAHIEFLLTLEKECGLRFEPRDILSVRTIGDAMTLVTTKQTQDAG